MVKIWVCLFMLLFLMETEEERIKSLLNFPEEQTIIAVIAVGYPAETPIAVNIDPDEAGQLYYEKDKIQKVPKLKTQYRVNWL